MKKKLIVLLATLIVTSMAYSADNQPPQRPPQPQGQRGNGAFIAMDANKDGKVTKEEMNAWFDKLDVNKDGNLTREECRPTNLRGAGPQDGKGPRGNGMRGQGPRNQQPK